MPGVKVPVKGLAPVNPPTLSPTHTAGHPVADNPIRLLSGGGWTSPKDLRQNCRKLSLQAKRVPIQPQEPGMELCPRIRSAEDYAAAEKAISDPSEFAIAVAFLPGNWENPRSPIRCANLSLLRAEGLPAQSSSRSKLVAEAVRAWESAESEAQITLALEQTAREDMLARRPLATQVEAEVYARLAKIVERTLADLGEGVHPEHFELFSVLADCRRLPEIRGLAAAEERAVDRLYTRDMRPFLDAVNVFLEQPEVFTQAKVSALEIKRLLATSADFRRAWNLIQKTPTAARRFEPDYFTGYEARRLFAAWIIASNQGAWKEAAVLMEGVGPEAAAEFGNLKDVLSLARRVIPAMAKAQASRDQISVIAELLRLKAEFPDLGSLLGRLIGSAHLLSQGQRATLADGGHWVQTASSRGSGPPRSRSRQSKSQVIICVIAGVIGLAIWSVNTSPPTAKKTFYSSSRSRTTAHTYSAPTPAPALVTGANGRTYHIPQRYLAELRADQAALDVTRKELEETSEEIDEMSSDLEVSRRLLDNTDRYEVNQFNAQVRRYNAQLQLHRESNAAYNARVDEYNAKLARYGSPASR